MSWSERAAWVVAVGLVLAPGEASACLCPWWGKPNPEAMIAEAKASVPNIFDGKVLEVRSSSDRPFTLELVSRVKVMRVTKGQLAVGDVVEVVTGEDTCGLRLSPGADYAVHATQQMATDTCMETRLLTPRPEPPGMSPACQKSAGEKLDVALPSYHAVFEGPVTSWRSSEPWVAEVNVKVDRVWKGRILAGESITVRVEDRDVSARGHMLVFARKKGGALVAERCSPSRGFFHDEDARIAELGPPPAVPPGSMCGGCTVGRAGESAPGLAGLGLVLGGLAWRGRRRPRLA